MKKVLTGILAIIIAVSASMAGNISDVLGREHDRIWLEMRDNWHNLATGGTLTNGLDVTGTITGTTVRATTFTCTTGTISVLNAGITNILSSTGLSVTGPITNTGIACYLNNLTVYTNSIMGGTLLVTGAVTFVTNAVVQGNLSATNMFVRKGLNVTGTVDVAGLATFSSATAGINLAGETTNNAGDVEGTTGLPAGTTTNATHVLIKVGGTNMWIQAWPANI